MRIKVILGQQRCEIFNEDYLNCLKTHKSGPADFKNCYFQTRYIKREQDLPKEWIRDKLKNSEWLEQEGGGKEK